MRRFDDVDYLDPAPPHALQALEKHFGVRFPQAYLRFMEASGGAAFMEDTHRFKAVFVTGITFPRLEWLYPVEQVRAQTETLLGNSTYDDEPNTLAPKMIVIGSAVDDTDEGPMILDLRPDAPNHGAVYFRHLTFSSALAGVGWFEALAWVAPCFEDLLDSLHALPESDRIDAEVWL